MGDDGTTEFDGLSEGVLRLAELDAVSRDESKPRAQQLYAAVKAEGYRLALGDVARTLRAAGDVRKDPNRPT